MSKITVHNGDCLDVLASLPKCSIDAVVTDPPYELGFMGKSWDASGVAFCPDTWRKVLRVLKPGGHMVAFGAPKNYHRLACAIEDAGFEVRDSLMWVFGQGFPKSQDVSKAIDKAGGINPREQAALLKKKRETAALSRDELAGIVGCTPSSIRDWEEGRARSSGAPVEWLVPSDNYRTKLADALGYSSDERRVVGASIDRRGDGTVYGVGHSGELRAGGNTDAAREWQGWGTALKPAYEPIVLARKPLSEGTVAANVLRWGTGAINVDATRVETNPAVDDPRLGGKGAWRTDKAAKNVYEGGYAGKEIASSALGRWPANLCHDGSQEVLEGFPVTAPAKKSMRGLQHSGRHGGLADIGGNIKHGTNSLRGHEDDGGSAARFFYCAKASKHDRAGSKHPTVKPVDLMQWLIRMVTPPGGTILDPFAGSGTTGVAAINEAVAAILIEREKEYYDDIMRRIA